MPVTSRNLITLIAIISIAAIIFWAFTAFRLSQLEKSSEQFGQALIESFFPGWDIDVFRSNASTEFINSLPEEALVNYIENMKALGNFQETQNIHGNIDSKIFFNADQDANSFIEADVQFDNDQAIVFIDLILEENSWKFSRFYLDSSLLEQ